MLQVLIINLFSSYNFILWLNTLSSNAPGHLPVKLPDYNNRLRILVATYVTFSPDGTELLVNMGGEQVITTLMKWREKRLLCGFGIEASLIASF